VIGVSIDQEGDVYNRIVGYHRDRGLRFQVISDFGMDVYHAYMGTRTISIPQTFIVDRDGSLYVQLTGPQQYDEFATYIRELI
jgi:peroxiredoxin